MASNLQTYGYGKKKQTAILKPSELAALEKQYGMTDGGGRAQTTVSNAVTSTVPTTRQPAVQRPAVIKPSVQAAREKQYGITDWKDTKPQTAVKPEAVPTVVSTQKVEMPASSNNTIDTAARDRALKTAQAEKEAYSRLQARAVEDMELYRTETGARLKALQQYQAYADRIAAAEDVIRRATESTAADWEAQKAAEIQAAGGNELLLQLMRLDELETRIIKEAAELGEDRRTEYGTGLTENQQQYNAMYRALSVLYGSEEVSSWLEYVDRRRNSDQMAKNLEKAASIAEEYPFWSSVGSIPLNMFSGFGYLDVAGQNLQRFATGSDAPIDYNSPAQTPSRMTNTIRGTVSKDMSGGEKFLYNTAMSMGDSALAMTMGNFGMGLLGGAAATNAMQAAADRGANNGQALTVGLIAGATEYLMEKASIDSLFSLKTPSAARGFVYNVLKQAGVEGTEEGLTNIVNTIADGLIMRDRSELETIKRQLMANGASRGEAELAAIQVWSKEFALDVAGGFLSGSTFGTVKSGGDYIGTTRKLQNNTAPDSNRNGIKTDHREEISYGEGIHLRNGGQWIGGQNSGGQVSAVEAGTGRDQGRQGQVEPADSGAASLSYGQKVSTAGLGIRGGSAEANIQIVNSGETVATRAAMNIAQENGLELMLFAGGNLQISNVSGKTDSVRGYIEGNRVYVRADHPVYTAEQLMRHEVGHAQIARGEINPDTVRQRITKTYGIGHTVQLSILYAAAYEGSGMTGGEIWEEIICDSLGDMNIFQEYTVRERVGRLLNEVRESVEAETRMDRGTHAEDTNVGGKMSRDSGYKKVSQQAWRQIQRERMSRYGSHFDTMPRMDTFYAHDMLFVIENFDESSFGVVERINPATQLEKANIVLEVMKDGSIEYASEYRRRVENLRRWQRQHARNSVHAENTGTGEKNAGASAQHGNTRNGGTTAGKGHGVDEVNPKRSIKELSDRLNPDYYDDGEIVYMYLDGYTLTLEMQENGEFSVIRREKGVHHGKSVGNYGSVGESNESTGISGKRNTNGDRDNRSGGQSAGNSKGSGVTGRSNKNAERSGEGDAADHSQTDAVEIKGKTSRELDLSRVVAEMGGYGNFSSTDDEHLAFIKRLEEVQVRLKAEELRQAYLRNMARLEEAEREAEMDAAFWKYWD